MERNKKRNQTNSNKEEFGNEIEITSNKRRNSERSNEHNDVNQNNYNYEFGSEKYNHDLNHNNDYNLKFTKPNVFDYNSVNTDFSTEFEGCYENKEQRSTKRPTTEKPNVTSTDKISKKTKN